MSKYIKKQVAIEAVQFVITERIQCKYGVATKNNGMEICKFMNLPKMGVHTDSKGDYIAIKTLEGVMRCDIDDYVIKGVSGEFYPCKPDIFKMTYFTESEYAEYITK